MPYLQFIQNTEYSNTQQNHQLNVYSTQYTKNDIKSIPQILAKGLWTDFKHSLATQ